MGAGGVAVAGEPHTLELSLCTQALDAAKVRQESAPLYVCRIKVCPVCERPIVAVALRAGDPDACQCERG